MSPRLRDKKYEPSAALTSVTRDKYKASEMIDFAWTLVLLTLPINGIGISARL
jgi:hypothetical protein